MSAMPPTATESVRRNESTRGAITGREQVQQTNVRPMRLLDDLVGAGEQRGRQIEAERLGGPVGALTSSNVGSGRYSSS
jgi:hypothetical protein